MFWSPYFIEVVAVFRRTGQAVGASVTCVLVGAGLGAGALLVSAAAALLSPVRHIAEWCLPLQLKHVYLDLQFLALWFGLRQL